MQDNYCLFCILCSVIHLRNSNRTYRHNGCSSSIHATTRTVRCGTPAPSRTRRRANTAKHIYLFCSSKKRFFHDRNDCACKQPERLWTQQRIAGRCAKPKMLSNGQSKTSGTLSGWRGCFVESRSVLLVTRLRSADLPRGSKTEKMRKQGSSW